MLAKVTAELKRLSATKTNLGASNCCFPGEQAIKTELSFKDFVSLIRKSTCSPSKFMSEKKIKVVKRAERGKRKPASAKTRRDSARKAARDMVATVTDWVNEFQEKQTRDTTKAINNLMRARQQPNEA